MSCFPLPKDWLPSMGAVILSHYIPALFKGFAIAVHESDSKQEDSALSRLLGTRFTQTLPQSGFHITCGKLPGLVDPHACHPREKLNYTLVGQSRHYYGL